MRKWKRRKVIGRDVCGSGGDKDGTAQHRQEQAQYQPNPAP